MQQSILLNLCKWDFVTYDDALKISPGERNIIIYRNTEGIDASEQSENNVIQIEKKPFGFYSWMPTNESDRAIVLKHKTKPKLWTKHKVEDIESVNFICSTIERIISAKGFLVGITCTEESIFEKNFIAGFATSALNPVAVFAKFSISERQMATRNHTGKIGYLNFIAQEVLHCRKKLYWRNKLH